VPGGGQHGAMSGPVEVLGQRGHGRDQQEVVAQLTVGAYARGQRRVRQPGAAAEGRRVEIRRAQAKARRAQLHLRRSQLGQHAPGVARIGQSAAAVGLDHHDEHRASRQPLQVARGLSGAVQGHLDDGLMFCAQAGEIEDEGDFGRESG
jgi:hypothetical protein